MKRCHERLQNERGSALLLVMLAVVFVGILFGGLYTVSQVSHEQALTHKLQVQAEYDAQKMMDIALYYFYLDDDHKTFDEQFADNHCLSPDGEDEVCLEVNDDGERFLLATGRDKQENSELERVSTIKYILPQDDEAGGGGTYRGDVCEQQTSFIRALSLGADLDLTRALPDAQGAEETDSVTITGGIHLDNSGEIIVPGDPLSETLPIRVNLGGYLSPQGGIVWGEHPQSPAPPYERLGNFALEGTTCAPSLEWHHYLTAVATTVANEEQRVDVYRFVGNFVTGLDTGSKKDQGSNLFEETAETLNEVLQNPDPKIILIEGSVLLEQEPTTNGWLIIYDPDPDAPANIYLPDRFVWKHQGAVLADRIGRMSRVDGKRKLSFEWPQGYQLAITLTREQANLYKQD